MNRILSLVIFCCGFVWMIWALLLVLASRALFSYGSRVFCVCVCYYLFVFPLFEKVLCICFWLCDSVPSTIPVCLFCVPCLGSAGFGILDFLAFRDDDNHTVLVICFLCLYIMYAFLLFLLYRSRDLLLVLYVKYVFLLFLFCRFHHAHAPNNKCKQYIYAVYILI